MEHEKDKKRNYQQRVDDEEVGSFTPLVFWDERGNGLGMQAFSKQPGGQTSPPPPQKKTASRMPVPYHIPAAVKL